MLKAVDGGSSVGLELVEKLEDVPLAIQRLVKRGFRRCFLEEFIDGRSVTVSVLSTQEGYTALPPLECATKATFYDEATKLDGTDNESVEYRVPVDLGNTTTSIMLDGARTLANFLGCQGALRVDYVVNRDGHAHALEINTIPGLQPHSNLPVACAAAGISYEVLITTMLADALADQPVPELVLA